jgi:hypothetical protein
MVTTTSNLGGMFEAPEPMTNKGPSIAPTSVVAAPAIKMTPAPALRKCTTCDETITEADEVCPKCFILTEDAKPILLD